jgi:hypothetical protein
MEHLANFLIFEKVILGGKNMKERAEILRKIIRGRLETDDVTNKDKFDFKKWSQSIKELKEIYVSKKFSLSDSLNLLYVEPSYLPAFVQFKKPKHKKNH